MQRTSDNSAIGKSSANNLGDVLGVIERVINDNDKLILTVSSRLSYNDLVNRLFIGSYIIIANPSTGSELLLRVNKVESTINPSPSISGANATYVKIVGKFIISRIRSNDGHRYTSLLMLPISGSLVIYPGSEVIRDFLGLRGNLLIGKALINGYDIPITINEDALMRGLLIMGQPGCGKSLLIKGLIKELRLSNYGNIVVLDRTGEYTRSLVENGIDVLALIPVDLMRLGRPIDIDELRRYVVDMLRMLGFRSRVKISMSASSDYGIKFSAEFQGGGLGRLGVIPLSIRFRWFIERAINYLNPEIRHVITALMLENENALNTVQAFISAVRDPELLNMVGKESVNKAIDFAYSLRDSGFFDAVVNAGNREVDISVFSPLRALRGNVVIIDLHGLPIPLMDIYEVVLIEDIVKWIMRSKSDKTLLIVDNAEGLMYNEDLVNSLINSMRISKYHGVSFIVATRSFSRKLYNEFSNFIIMRMSKPLNLSCPEGANLLNNEFILISPLLNIKCIKGSVA
ncbi:helicase HerA domain-containing protein [Vulcanisaeta sp. JCM 14467]|uniref:helicase HerA domain-containing protein n=1 Tax=Vulcanisaeta sp. JCM 14467 TaxID=1295370 RepID=UPI0006D16D02|nr:DUF87 domain-containing protein [Vulcanisaeta sp. JCM 14467]